MVELKHLDNVCLSLAGAPLLLFTFLVSKEIVLSLIRINLVLVSLLLVPTRQTVLIDSRDWPLT